MRKTTASFAIVLLSLAWCIAGFSMGGEHPAGFPVGQHPDWPEGLANLLNSPGRVYGYWVNANDWFFYAGDTDGLNRFLKQYKALSDTPLTLVLHSGRGKASRMGYREEKVEFDWEVKVFRRGWHPDAPPDPTRSKPGYVVSVEAWLGGNLELGELKVPLNVELVSGGEIEKFIAAHEAKRVQARRTETVTSHGIAEAGEETTGAEASEAPAAERAKDAEVPVEAPIEKPIAAEKGTFVVMHRAALAESSGARLTAVLDACNSLVNEKKERILDAGEAYRRRFGKRLSVRGYPSEEATEKARWVRDWLSRRASPGSTIVLLGDEKALPTWQVRLGRISFTTDSFYSDLDGDGVPDTAVSRVLGTHDTMIRQLEGKKDYGPKAVILCSEDTRIHLETRAFAKSLSGLGYAVAIRGARDDEALTASDLIIHFGHGSPANISNRFGETFVSAGDVPSLPRSPIVFVDGCGTLPVGSPLLHSFLEQGALAYVGSTATVQGMIPARFTNELVEHFLGVLAERPRSTLPELLMAARAAYVQGHPGLNGRLRQLAATGEVNVSGDESTDLLTVAEWVYYGDPRAVVPRLGAAVETTRRVVSLAAPVRLDKGNPSWRTGFGAMANDGQAVLSLYAEIPLSDRADFSVSVRQNGKELSVLDSHSDTYYQNIGRDCRGGYVSNDTYRVRFLVPLIGAVGERELEVRLVGGTSAVLTPGTEVDVWPPDFEKKIGLRSTPPAGKPGRIRTITAVPVRRTPVKALAVAKLRPTGVRGFLSLDLSTIFNRPHNSVQVGGGDNASFETWFSEDKVSADGVPFFVRRTGDDVLVSENNTENVYEIKGVETSARALHFLIWGYLYPRQPAKLCITFSDGSSQECELPLSEWTQAKPPVAFDFQNTVRGFKHAAITHQVIEVHHPQRKIVSIASTSGTYGLIAITLQEARPEATEAEQAKGTDAEESPLADDAE